MNLGEQIFEALNDVGTDLVDMAEHERFSKPFWRRALPLAASLALLMGMGAAVKHYFPDLRPKQPEPDTPVQMEYPVQPVDPQPNTPDPAEPEPLTPLPFYIYDPDPASDYTPSKAIDPEGNVILSVESGRIEPMVDQLTGEYLGIQVYHLPEGKDIGYAWIDTYTLEGKQVMDHLVAYDQQFLGKVRLINSYMDHEYTASLYDTERQAYIRGDLRTALVIGDAICATPLQGGGTENWFFDENGQLTVIDRLIDSYHNWNGKTYLNVLDDAGRMGLMDTKGNLLVPCAYTEIYSTYNGYVRCRDENSHYAIDLETGEVVFQWPYDIVEVCDNLVVAQDKDRSCILMDWEGNLLRTAIGLQPFDLDGNGEIDLLFLADSDGYTFLNSDGSVLATLSSFSGSVELLSPTTVALCRSTADGATVSLLNLETGRETQLDKHYSEAYSIWQDDRITGLFYAVHQNGVDLLREDGTLLLEHLRDHYSMQGDVFFCTEPTASGLKKPDGTWLYQEPLPHNSPS